jgi:hypothetical protein
MEGHVGHTMTDMSTHQHMPDHDMPASCSMNVIYKMNFYLYSKRRLLCMHRCCLTGK